MVEKIRPRNMVFALIVFLIMMAGYIEFSSDIFDNYNVDLGNSSLEVFGGTESELKSLSTELKSATESRVTGIEPLDNFIVGTFSTLEFLFQLPTTIESFAQTVQQILKIPSAITTLITLAVTLILAFSIIEVITRSEV